MYNIQTHLSFRILPSYFANNAISLTTHSTAQHARFPTSARRSCFNTQQATHHLKTVTATNAAFVNRILQRDYVFQKDGPSIAKAPPCPRFYYYDPKLNRRPCNHRNPHQPGYKVASSSTNFLSGLLSVGFPSFSFLYHTTDSAIFFSQPHNQMSECQNFMNQLSVIQSERVVVSCC